MFDPEKMMVIFDFTMHFLGHTTMSGVPEKQLDTEITNRLELSQK